MESLESLSEYERQNFFIAIAMLFLGTITIISFIYLGAGIVFIILAVITIILGMYMAIRISNDKSIAEENDKPKGKKG